MSERLKRVPHAKRGRSDGPVHVVVRMRKGLPGLRTPRGLKVLKRAIREANTRRHDFSIVEFSSLSNHVHLMVEAYGDGLSRGMQGFMIRLAKALNRAWHRKGTVFSDRYYASVLKGINSVRRAIRYVLQNARKHGIAVPAGQPDPYSSAPWFPYWAEDLEPPAEPRPVALAQDPWLAAASRLCLSLHELPGPRF